MLPQRDLRNFSKRKSNVTPKKTPKMIQKRKTNPKVSFKLKLLTFVVDDEKQSGDKKEDKSEGSSEEQSWKDKARSFFFEPNGGPPRPEGWVGALAAAGTLYYIVNHK